MSTQSNIRAMFKVDLRAAISPYSKESSRPLAKQSTGSFSLWIEKNPKRKALIDWQDYCEELVRNSWLGPGDWEANGAGLLATNDIIVYAVTRLPKKFVKECRDKLFGSASNFFAWGELLIIGHALWQPECGVYLNPYTEDARPMSWQEILEREQLTQET